MHGINQLKEKCREQHTTLPCVRGYEKAFGSVQTKAILTSLQEDITPERHVYTDSAVTVHLHKESAENKINRCFLDVGRPSHPSCSR